MEEVTKAVFPKVSFIKALFKAVKLGRRQLNLVALMENVMIIRLSWLVLEK